MIAFGAVVLVFAIIGLISTIGFVGKGVSSLVSQDSRREEYEWLIMPVVLQDPAPFSSPDRNSSGSVPSSICMTSRPVSNIARKSLR